MFSEKEIEIIAFASNEVMNLIEAMDWEFYCQSDSLAYSERFGSGTPKTPEGLVKAFRNAWSNLLQACEGDAALAMEVAGIDNADELWSYLN